VRFAALAASAALALFLAGSSWAQPERKPKRVAIACSVCDEKSVLLLRDGLVENLRKAGVEPGRDFQVEHFFGGREGVPGEPELGRLIDAVRASRPDVFYPADLYALIAASKGIRDIPTVFSVYDPVGLGIVDRLARPGGNMTGFATSDDNLDLKRLQLLHQVIPKARRIAVLTQGSLAPLLRQTQRLREAARPMGLELHEYRAADGSTVGGDAQRLFEAMVRDRMEGFLLLDGNAFSTEVLQLATRYRLPAFYPYVTAVRRGGLASYAAKHGDPGGTVATYIARILRGATPGSLPVRVPDTYELTLNSRTAREIGLEFPKAVLVQAATVIE
jgi:putative ABC transport system substrate-binding protein